jgi:hypothetical protein
MESDGGAAQLWSQTVHGASFICWLVREPFELSRGGIWSITVAGPSDPHNGAEMSNWRQLKSKSFSNVLGSEIFGICTSTAIAHLPEKWRLTSSTGRRMIDGYSHHNSDCLLRSQRFKKEYIVVEDPIYLELFKDWEGLADEENGNHESQSPTKTSLKCYCAEEDVSPWIKATFSENIKIEAEMIGMMDLPITIDDRLMERSRRICSDWGKVGGES